MNRDEPNEDVRLILDGYNLIHRARGGFQLGEWPMVFNFFRGLKPIVEKFKPTVVYFVLEGTPKHNIELLPEYKANRALSLPPDFERQKNAILTVLDAMPIRLVRHPDFEADDVIHNIVLHTNASEPNVKNVIVSSDSDFTQLLQRHTNVVVWNWRTKKNVEAPSYDYVSWKALRGDPTDNIPKCHGMNDRTAIDVLNVPTRLSELLNDAEFKSTYERNHKLIELHDFNDEEWPLLQTSLAVNPSWEFIRKTFAGYGFSSMVDDVTWSRWVDAFIPLVRK